MSRPKVLSIQLFSQFASILVGLGFDVDCIPVQSFWCFYLVLLSQNDLPVYHWNMQFLEATSSFMTTSDKIGYTMTEAKEAADSWGQIQFIKNQPISIPQSLH